MSKTHKAAVVIIPPQDVWPPIQRIRQQHDRKVRRWMPHITIIYPFCDPVRFEPVAREARARIRKLKPFDVTLAEFDTFGHRQGHFTVWLKPETEIGFQLNDVLANVWTAMSYDEDFETERIVRFTPHLSVG